MKISFFARNHSHCQPLHEHGACKSGNHLQPNPACTFRAFPVKWAAKGRRKTMVKTGSTRLHARYCNLTPSSTFRRALHSSKFLAAYHANIRPFLDQTVCRCWIKQYAVVAYCPGYTLNLCYGLAGKPVFRASKCFLPPER